MDKELKQGIEKTDNFFAKYGENLHPRERDLIRLCFGMDDGRYRTIEELAQLFGETKEDTEKCIQNGIEKMSISIYGYYYLLHCIFAGNVADMCDCNYMELKEKIEAVLDELNEKERQVLQLRCGLLDNKEYTLRAIGEIMGITGERVRQIEGKALRKLRHPNRSKKLHDYKVSREDKNIL